MRFFKSFKLIFPMVFLGLFAQDVCAQKIFHSTRIKTEYQFSDYLDYTYPDPIYFAYPETQYTQPKPYIADFPEHRYLMRVIQNFDYRTALTLRYQYSGLDTDLNQKSYSAKFDREINDEWKFSLGTQYTDVSGRLNGWSFEGGFRYSFAGYIVIQPQFAYYTNNDFTEEADKANSTAASLLVRQVLNRETALQVKYSRFDSEGSENTFSSNTVTAWISRYFYSESALHLSLRYHWNSLDIKSWSPEAELVHYLNWASIIRLQYRYYSMDSDEQIIDYRSASSSFSEVPTFTSHSTAVIVEYLLLPKLTVSAKYRFYISDRDITMNTYLFGMEWLF